jgi:hypothetical protein
MRPPPRRNQDGEEINRPLADDRKAAGGALSSDSAGRVPGRPQAVGRAAEIENGNRGAVSGLAGQCLGGW